MRGQPGDRGQGHRQRQRHGRRHIRVTENCIKSKCATEIAACMANAKCALAVSCAGKCADLTCLTTCLAPLQTDAVADKIFSDAQDCSSNAQAACLPVTTQCGDGKCDTSETKTSCPQDCATNSDAGKTDTDVSTKAPGCGDLNCQANESTETCPFDCDTQVFGQASCIVANCSGELATCQAKPSCLQKLNCLVECKGISTCMVGCTGTGTITDPVIGCLSQHVCEKK